MRPNSQKAPLARGKRAEFRKMQFGKMVLGVMLAGAVAGGWTAMDSAKKPAKVAAKTTADPNEFLTPIHGAQAMTWVKAQNEKSYAALKSDPNYQPDHDAILKVLDANDRIPQGTLDHGDVLDFWQDAQHARGYWRKTTIADYRNAQPKWETIIDVDKLDADEKAQWVWQGADCLSDNTHCLVQLSPGGGDAATIREFNPTTKAFVKDGFALPLSKLSAAYFDKDDVLVATDFGPGTMTKSSYARILKLWHRGTPLASAKVVYEGTVDDVSVNPVVFRDDSGTTALVVRGLTAFTSE